VAGELTAFTGLRTLSDLDLHHVGVDEVFRRHTEATAGHLLYGRTLWIGRTVRQRREAIRLLTALTRVRLAADRVHGAGERRVGLAADRAEGHRTGGEALHDFGSRLDFLDRNRLATRLFGKLDAEEAADGLLLRAFAVDDAGEFLE